MLKRALLTIVQVCVATQLFASPMWWANWSTKAEQEFAQALTAAGRLGTPRYTTALLPICNSSNIGALVTDTTATAFKWCNGSSYQTVGTAAGTFVTGTGTDNTVPKFTTGASGIIGNSTITDNGTTVTVNTATTFLATPSGGSTTSNFLGITGALPSTMTANAYAQFNNITSAGSSSFEQSALATTLAAGYSGSSTTTAGRFVNLAAGTGSVVIGTIGGNMGAFIAAAGSGGGSSSNTGAYLQANGNTSKNYGLISVGDSGTTNVGVVGIGGGSGSPTARIGGFFGLGSLPTLISGVLQADNGAVATPIFVAHDNSAVLPTTGATATWTILDGANAQAGNMVLTSSTMTAENQAILTGDAIHSYTWSNAQVVALGGVTAGDINVATLPAKTVVKRAFIVIITPDTSTNALTVSCGDATVGTPFTNYVLPGDAKATANTVYGDAISGAETGASLFDATAKWIPGFLPSYTATTLVTCHFIKTTTNLSTVTGSTGRVILETSLLP